jgi:hypothetical protein
MGLETRVKPIGILRPIAPRSFANSARERRHLNYSWMAESFQVPDTGRMNVHTSVVSVG